MDGLLLNRLNLQGVQLLVKHLHGQTDRQGSLSVTDCYIIMNIYTV